MPLVMTSVNKMGRINCKIAIFNKIHTIGSLPAMAAMVPNWPTSPLVPMPAPMALFVMANNVVDSGPKMALTMISGSQITGFSYDIGHLQHAGAQALADQPAHAVFPVAGHGKAQHISHSSPP